MAEHPIQGLMATAMENIKDMVDVNTIVGDAVQAPDGTVIIPISKVTFGFAAGGGEYSSCCTVEGESEDNSEDGNSKPESKFPFVGGSGGGVSINPVAFMVVGQGQIKLLPVNMNSSLEKVLDLIPDLIEKTKDSVKKNLKVKKEIKSDDANAKCAKEDE
ncbi:GerW family sporulation protein [Acetivibrio mesophilus]|jgi:sporulation protein YtfJ|uniref:Sporulation protein YtfJ n=1 Tax=Acetivibrio mesophilus TaxID=2487273 RepID=A0A4V1K1X5_9FIRM|nr:GerW family sporulation protein [Acetivibrio mesophilus]ODM25461.1 sporulation protein YtfJ [Clostridium sp. Bc-iso-3]RXE58309.1 sporulation protein YtfJ [Acetivibrio mesophilus]HHV28865.1 sporulation protein YtfJ [Clostridium sp.]